MSRGIPAVVKRRIRRRLNHSRGLTWADYLNTFLTTFLSVGMLAMAYAQWRATERQGDIADALASLEFAKSAAKFDFKLSKNVVSVGAGFVLPRTITVAPISGVKSLETLDGMAELSVSDSNGNYICDIEVRGLYIENEPGVLSPFDEPVQSFRTFLAALSKQKLSVTGSLNTRVIYNDLFGKEIWKQYQIPGGLDVSDSPIHAAVLYSGAWSNGQGLFFDPTEPPTSCSSAAKLITAAAKATGGKSANLGE